jgi:hypothetical protein
MRTYGTKVTNAKLLNNANVGTRVVDIFTIDFTVTFTSGPLGWGNYVTEFLTVSDCYVIPPP